MLLQSIKRKTFAFAVVAAVASVSLQVDAAHAEGPFARFAGHWRGDGKISLSNGTHESIRCRVNYAVGNAGTVLAQDLVCASQSYKFDVRSEVQAQGSALSGTWSETTRGVTGAVSGRVGGGTIQATVSGGTFSAGLALTVRGSTQYVTIRPSGPTDVVGVSVVLKRG
jgi:hypothetical protein